MESPAHITAAALTLALLSGLTAACDKDSPAKAPLTPPADVTLDPDTAGFMKQAALTGRAVEDAVTRTTWRNQSGAFSFSSLRTKRKKTRRYHTLIVLRQARRA